MYMLKTTLRSSIGWRKPQTSTPENQNEMLMIMAHHVLQKIMLSIHSSPFLCLMVDEATDVSNKEQLTIIIRWVDEDLNVFEDFLGLPSNDNRCSEYCGSH